jgi:hypothetical protein
MLRPGIAAYIFSAVEICQPSSTIPVHRMYKTTRGIQTPENQNSENPIRHLTMMFRTRRLAQSTMRLETAGHQR